MKTKLSRTVFIGLGGTGAQTIVRLKANFMENFGKIPPMIKLLAIDTDSRLKISYSTTSGKEYMLDEHEFKHLMVEDVVSYINNNPKTCGFFPKDLIKAKTSIYKGAGQFRAFGRLPLIREFDTNFKVFLENTIKNVRNWIGDRDSDFEVDKTGTNVFVVFSLAGGTGAGTFIDFPLMIKGSGILETKEKIIGVGVLPDVYSSFGLHAINTKPNAIAGITEYEFLANNVMGEMLINPNSPELLINTPTAKYKVDYNYLYDSFILVNNYSTTNQQYDKPGEIADLISKSLFLVAGSAGGENESTLDNIFTNAKVSEESYGKPSRYLGIGCAELVLNRERIADYCSFLLAGQLCQLISREIGKQDYDHAVQDRVSGWNIQEDQNQDDVITKLLSNKLKNRFINLSEFDDGAAQTIKAKRTAWIESFTVSIKDEIYSDEGSLNQLKGDKLKNLTDYIYSKVSEPGGVAFSNNFILVLKGRLLAMIEEMRTESAAFDKKKEQVIRGYDEKLAAISASEKISKFNVFKNKSRKIEEACEDFVESVNREALYISEIERRNAAVSFFQSLIDRINSMQNQIVNFQSRLSKIITIISKNIQTIRSRNPQEPFTVHLTPHIIQNIKVNANEDDLERFIKNNLPASFIFTEQTEIELLNIFLKFCQKEHITQENKKLNILDALNELEKSKVEEILDDLKDAIGILRTIDKNYDKITVANKYVIGVSNSNHISLINHKNSQESFEKKTEVASKTEIQTIEGSTVSKSIPDDLGHILDRKFSENGKAPMFANTGDESKIIITAFESTVPAFVVNNFRNYKQEMDNSTGISPIFRFANKYWGDIILKTNYSIFPVDTDDTLKIWSLGLLVSYVEKMQLIGKQKNRDYFVAVRSMGSNITELDSFRPKAFEIFNQKQLGLELMVEIKDKIRNNLSTYKSLINELIEDKTDKKYIDEIANHQLDKKTLNSNSHNQTRELILKELDFIKSIGNLSEII
ncbi:MAG TPA: tubulin-like doman-containing protein [Bacteroidales bacterium]|nr:tubulin-like doman-containing protein [Bacteroidales bacterium]